MRRCLPIILALFLVSFFAVLTPRVWAADQKAKTKTHLKLKKDPTVVGKLFQPLNHIAEKRHRIKQRTGRLKKKRGAKAFLERTFLSATDKFAGKVLGKALGPYVNAFKVFTSIRKKAQQAKRYRRMRRNLRSNAKELSKRGADIENNIIRITKERQRLKLISDEEAKKTIEKAKGTRAVFDHLADNLHKVANRMRPDRLLTGLLKEAVRKAPGIAVRNIGPAAERIIRSKLDAELKNWGLAQLLNKIPKDKHDELAKLLNLGTLKDAKFKLTKPPLKLLDAIKRGKIKKDWRDYTGVSWKHRNKLPTNKSIQQILDELKKQLMQKSKDIMKTHLPEEAARAHLQNTLSEMFPDRKDEIADLFKKLPRSQEAKKLVDDLKKLMELGKSKGKNKAEMMKEAKDLLKKLLEAVKKRKEGDKKAFRDLRDDLKDRFKTELTNIRTNFNVSAVKVSPGKVKAGSPINVSCAVKGLAVANTPFTVFFEINGKVARKKGFRNPKAGSFEFKRDANIDVPAGAPAKGYTATVRVEAPIPKHIADAIHEDKVVKSASAKFVVVKKDEKQQDSGSAAGGDGCPVPAGAEKIIDEDVVKYKLNGRNVGPYTTFYENERTRKKSFSCRNSKGEMHGEAYQWYENGALDKMWTWKNNKLNGRYISQTKEGKLWDKGTYQDGVKEGLWIESGDEYTYVGGVQNGPYRIMSGGKVFAEGNKRNGKSDGPSKRYHPNGKVAHVGSYKMGKAVGTHVEYHEDGWKTKETIHGESSKDVEWTQYRPDGSWYMKCRWAPNQPWCINPGESFNK